MNRGNGIIGFIVLVAIIWGVYSLFNGDDDNDYSRYQPAATYYGSGYSSGYDYDDYPVGFEGTDTMEACNGNTGNCYDLEIDSDGENVERINFPNGGWRDVYYSDCEEGYCVVEDEDGTEWELQY